MRNFNGQIEERNALIRLTGNKIGELLRGFPNDFGKKKKKRKINSDDPKKNIYEGEPFILASQAHQVFYVQDLIRDG